MRSQSRSPLSTSVCVAMMLLAAGCGGSTHEDSPQATGSNSTSTMLPSKVVKSNKGSGTGSTAQPSAADSLAYPFANQKLYVDPYSQAALYVNSSSNIYPREVMQKVSLQPTAVWVGDWNTDVGGYVKDYVGRAVSTGTMPVITAYNIPKRDCGSYSSGGTTAADYPLWIEKIAVAIGNAKAAVILEPDALGLIDQPGCLTITEKSERYQLIKGATTTLRKYAPNTAIYIDAGNSNWIGASTMAQHLVNAGIASANGFSLNVSNFHTTESNVTYGTQLSGLVGGKHFVIDTSRNGLGPTADYEWCNPSGRALGTLPQGFSSGLVDAYLWIKRPGESDGTCNGGPDAGGFWPQYAYDLAIRMMQ